MVGVEQNGTAYYETLTVSNIDVMLKVFNVPCEGFREAPTPISTIPRPCSLRCVRRANDNIGANFHYIVQLGF